MNKAIALPDRAADLSLRLLAWLNVLFLVVFLALLSAATGQARAETVACTGVDLMAGLERDDPTAAGTIRREADATLNGSGLLWTVEKPGVPASYLFGTMHLTDPRVTDLTPRAQAAFDAAGTVVIETTEVLDEAKMLASLMAEPDLMMFTDDTTLMSLLSPEDQKLVAEALDRRGIPPGSVAKMKPWMLSAALALPACELARKEGGAPMLDIKLARDAKAQGKTLEGLETVVSQMRAMASLPMDFHMKGLVETLKLGDRMDDVIETMIVLYENEDTGAFWPLFRAVLPAGEGDDAGYAEFEEAMITSRNQVMADNAAPILDRGGAFVAVGALHLPGPEGLVEKLRRAGYTVTAAR